MRKLRVGDKVRLDPNKVTESDLSYAESGGVIGKVYIVDRVSADYSHLAIRLEGSNWHEVEWLTLVLEKNIVGGELIGT